MTSTISTRAFRLQTSAPIKGRAFEPDGLNAHHVRLHGGSSAESGFEPGTLRPQSRDLTPSPPIITNGMDEAYGHYTFSQFVELKLDSSTIYGSNCRKPGFVHIRSSK
ncbi:hypothetical protein AVEN_158654-1 [Araneus ventricosus]|uniref:Uncharacterized protein n=1 Tax=Araneus ventricosus TaxID=182803 RepID=A0A4Y2X1A5_ARAVE|nr:hypothetical protein AVEN_158654-1 [Araneus ventricosus]